MNTDKQEDKVDVGKLCYDTNNDNLSPIDRETFYKKVRESGEYYQPTNYDCFVAGIRYASQSTLPTDDLWREILSIIFEVHEQYLPKQAIDHEQSELYMYMAKRIAAQQSTLSIEGVKQLESAMSMFGEAHNLLAKTKLLSKDYQPINILLSKAKVELFNYYQKVKSLKPPIEGEREKEILYKKVNDLEFEISRLKEENGRLRRWLEDYDKDYAKRHNIG